MYTQTIYQHCSMYTYVEKIYVVQIMECLTTESPILRVICPPKEWCADCRLYAMASNQKATLITLHRFHYVCNTLSNNMIVGFSSNSKFLVVLYGDVLLFYGSQYYNSIVVSSICIIQIVEGQRPGIETVFMHTPNRTNTLQYLPVVALAIIKLR